MILNIENKRVLITGGSRGIGLSIAEKFLMEGAKVQIVSRGSEKLYESESKLKKLYGKDNVLASKCDCTNKEELLDLRNNLKNDWNNLDILICNLGNGESAVDPLPNNDEWEETWKNNFESALHTTRTFLPLLKKSKGVILFISSIAGIEAFGAPTDYSTSKLAVIGLAKNLSRKLAPDIRVNVIAPGNIYFEGGSWEKKMKNDKKNVENMINTQVPMKRFGKPEEVADAAVFLCSNKAKFITGTTLVIDGGQTTSY